MPDEPFALSTIPAALPDEADFDSIHSAVQATLRGRWFLEEYAKRNRNADTGQLVAAIERIESMIRGDIAQRAQQSMRIELLEMARAIAKTRAEVAETPSPKPEAEQAGQEPDVAVAAARLREIAATMRGRGIEPSTSEKIDALASSILSAAPLHDPDSNRAQKLGEVLQYLEHRIDRLLDSADSDARAEVPADVPAALAQELPTEVTEPAAAVIEPAEPAPETLEIVALWTEPPPAAVMETPEAPPSQLSSAQQTPAIDHPTREQARVAGDGAEGVDVDVGPLDVEPLDVEPLVVVPAGAPAAHAAAPAPPPAPALELAPLPLPPVADQPAAATSDDTVDENAESQATADPSLIWAVQAPQAPELPEPPPEPAARRDEIDIEPLTVLPLTATRVEITEPPAAAAEEAAEPAAMASAAPQAAEAVAAPAAASPLAEPAPDDTPTAAVDTQVETDLETLGILSAGPEAPPPAPPIESDLLSNAWETAITSEPVEAPPADQQETSPEAASAAASPPTPSPPTPEPPSAAAVEAAAEEEAPADFLLEPLPDTETVVAQPEVSRASGQNLAASELEDELFESEPEPMAASTLTPPAAVNAALATIASAAVPAAAAASPATAAAPMPVVAAVRMGPKPMPRHAVGDPLAALKSMSDEERLALFT
jgi:hypothetical protein